MNIPSSKVTTEDDKKIWIDDVAAILISPPYVWPLDEAEAQAIEIAEVYYDGCSPDEAVLEDSTYWED